MQYAVLMANDNYEQYSAKIAKADFDTLFQDNAVALNCPILTSATSAAVAVGPLEVTNPALNPTSAPTTSSPTPVPKTDDVGHHYYSAGPPPTDAPVPPPVAPPGSGPVAVTAPPTALPTTAKPSAKPTYLTHDDANSAAANTDDFKPLYPIVVRNQLPFNGLN